MAFQNHDIEADEGFCPESDPVIRRLEAKRKGIPLERTAGAAVMQDISLHTYWANTVGKTKYPGSYHLYLEELRDNLHDLMRTRMAYRQLEEFLVTLGYEAGDIRQVFKESTGLDPTKLEHQRQQDVNMTPANIPWYSLAWGYSKKSDAQSYFVMPGENGLFKVYAQVDDMTRKEVGVFLLEDEAAAYLKAFCSKVYRYDQPISHQIDQAMSKWNDESQKKEYMVMANNLYDQQKKGNLDIESAERSVVDAVRGGQLTETEGQDLLDLYVHAGPEEAEQTKTEPAPEGPKQSPDMDYRQDTGNVMEEVNRTTPADFFKSVLPDRMDTITPDHIKEVLSYISHRGKDMTEFDVNLHSLEYQRHQAPQALVNTNPDTGRPAGPPRATVSVILEIIDKTLPKGKNLKYALSVFFVNPDGDIGSSDSLKGEDDIIYGFSEDGLRQYFSRERLITNEF